MKQDADFQNFCKVWLSDVREGNPSTVELGRRFARKLDNRLVFVFATDKPLNMKERYALSDIRAMGKDRFGERFEVDTVSIATIYQRTLESNRIDEHLEISLKGNFVESRENLLVGSVTLSDLYDFLKGYYIKTGDLDQLYEKNIRLFLGIRGKVNKSIDA